MNNKERSAAIKKILTHRLQATQLEITDESHLHQGHAGARSGKGHFAIHISSKAFYGKSNIEQHQMVYHALAELMETDIHALSIKCTQA